MIGRVVYPFSDIGVTCASCGLPGSLHAWRTRSSEGLCEIGGERQGRVSACRVLIRAGTETCPTTCSHTRQKIGTSDAIISRSTHEEEVRLRARTGLAAV